MAVRPLGFTLACVLAVRLYLVGVAKTAKALRSSVKDEKLARPVKACYFNVRWLRIVALLALAIVLLGVRGIGNVFNRHLILAKPVR